LTDVFSTVVLGNVDECRAECEISDDGQTVAVVYENDQGWHVQALRSIGDEERSAFNASVAEAKQTLSHYVNRLGANPPKDITVSGLSLWLMERDDGTVLGMKMSDFGL
jgi:hypothetical protein